MEDINRLKLLLVEKKKTSKWLSEKLGLILPLFPNGALTLLSQTLKPSQRLPSFSMSE